MGTTPIACCLLSPGVHLRRRDDLSVLGGAAGAGPLAADTQQAERMRRVRVIMAIEGSDPLTQSRQATLRTRLQKVRWIEARTLRIDLRSGVSELAEFFSFSGNPWRRSQRNHMRWSTEVWPMTAWVSRADPETCHVLVAPKDRTRPIMLVPTHRIGIAMTHTRLVFGVWCLNFPKWTRSAIA